MNKISPLDATRQVAWPEGTFSENNPSLMHSVDIQDLMHHNDDRFLSEEDREFAIRDSFKSMGIEVEFVD